MPEAITVVGAGLAGSSAALEAAKRGVPVALYEMRPAVSTPAHTTDKLAELVCSNSLGSMRLDRAQGLLKEELRLLDSEFVKIAERWQVPAGTALTVDRVRFSGEVTERIEAHPLIELVRQEITEIPSGITVLASGPLTSKALSESIKTLCGSDYLYFYDASAPIVGRESLDMSRLSKASRYDAGEAGFLNAFMSKEEYLHFYAELMKAAEHPLHDADKDRSFFEGCLPVEEIARRGERSLAFGPLRPTGFRDSNGRRPHAVVQLRPEDGAHTSYNLVGFQTNLRNSEQERVFRMIPGLERAKFLQYGRLHRNTYINSPMLIDETLAFRTRGGLFVSGQLSGAEGYVSAIATGLVAGINASRLAQGGSALSFPSQTMLGALLARLSGKGEYASLAKRFNPTKPIFALLPSLTTSGKKTDRQAYASRSLSSLGEFLKSLPEL